MDGCIYIPQLSALDQQQSPLSSLSTYPSPLSLQFRSAAIHLPTTHHVAPERLHLCYQAWPVLSLGDTSHAQPPHPRADCEPERQRRHEGQSILLAVFRSFSDAHPCTGTGCPLQGWRCCEAGASPARHCRESGMRRHASCLSLSHIINLVTSLAYAPGSSLKVMSISYAYLELIIE